MTSANFSDPKNTTTTFIPEQKKLPALPTDHQHQALPLMGDKWQHTRLRVMRVSGEAVVFKDESSCSVVAIRGREMIIQFKPGGSVSQSNLPFAYEAVPD